MQKPTTVSTSFRGAGPTILRCTLTQVCTCARVHTRFQGTIYMLLGRNRQRMLQTQTRTRRHRTHLSERLTKIYAARPSLTPFPPLPLFAFLSLPPFHPSIPHPLTLEFQVMLIYDTLCAPPRPNHTHRHDCSQMRALCAYHIYVCANVYVDTCVPRATGSSSAASPASCFAGFSTRTAGQFSSDPPTSTSTDTDSSTSTSTSSAL